MSDSEGSSAGTGLLAEGEALEAGNTDDYFGIAETLLIMMQQHNTKEENMLYPMCDQHLGGDGAPVLAQLRSELAVP